MCSTRAKKIISSRMAEASRDEEEYEMMNRYAKERM